MVGGFQFIRASGSGATRRGPAIGTGLLVALALVVTGSVGARIRIGIDGRAPTIAVPRLPDVAAPPATPAPSLAAPAALPAKARVSMSAASAPSEAGPGDGRRPHDVPDDFPLTRAAARQRVESMSPAGWLAHYGAVSIERHE
jgi:hypothetical protein